MQGASGRTASRASRGSRGGGSSRGGSRGGRGRGGRRGRVPTPIPEENERTPTVSDATKAMRAYGKGLEAASPMQREATLDAMGLAKHPTHLYVPGVSVPPKDFLPVDAPGARYVFTGEIRDLRVQAPNTKDAKVYGSLGKWGYIPKDEDDIAGYNWYSIRDDGESQAWFRQADMKRVKFSAEEIKACKWDW